MHRLKLKRGMQVQVLKRTGECVEKGIVIYIDDVKQEVGIKEHIPGITARFIFVPKARAWRVFLTNPFGKTYTSGDTLYILAPL